MSRLRLLVGAVLALAAGGLAFAEPVPLINAQGTIDKVEKGLVTIRPRGADGKFEKAITLKVTGTSTITAVSTRKGTGKNKVVIVQKETKAKDLEAKQVIAFIYTSEGGTPTLLSGVVQPAEEK